MIERKGERLATFLLLYSLVRTLEPFERFYVAIYRLSRGIDSKRVKKNFANNSPLAFLKRYSK